MKIILKKLKYQKIKFMDLIELHSLKAMDLKKVYFLKMELSLEFFFIQ